MILLPCALAGWSLRCGWATGNCYAIAFGIGMLLVGGLVEAALWDENSWLHHRLIVLDKRDEEQN